MERGDRTILKVDHLKKKIRGQWIIKDVSFQINEGEIFGFLGPNGSGKTTTIRMLVDLIRPTEGTITVCGKDVHKQHREAMELIGSIVENPELYPYLTGWENLSYFADMMKGVGKQRIAEVVDIVGLDQRIHDKVKTYSLGMKQRLGIAQALLGSPKLLILDEPTNGLDPQGIKELRDFVKRLAGQGLSLFISSHLLSEVQAMCDRVAIVRKGEVIATGTVKALLEQAVDKVVWSVEPSAKAKSIFASWPSLEVESADREPNGNVPDDPRPVVTHMKPEDIPALNEKLVHNEVRVHAISIQKPQLEDLFLRLTEGDPIV